MAAKKQPNLRHQFGQDFASSAFRDVDGDKAIVGKYGIIVQLEDGLYDVWFVRPDGSPLTEHKITAVAKNLPENTGLVRLDGEAYAQGRGEDWVREMASLVGVKKRKQLSPEARARAAERMRKVAAQRHGSN